MKPQHQINAAPLNRFFCCTWHRARAAEYAVENMTIGNASLSFRCKPESSGFNATPGLSDGHASAQLSTFAISVIDTSQSLGITLSWSKPINREDSAALAMSEISSYRIYFGTKGLHNNKLPNLGRRGARLARRGNAGIWVIFQVFATRTGEMNRPPKRKVIVVQALSPTT
ncbi:hypothetical protein MNBD_GAMMA18-297 [hydrothermal vent metagenome]|uniref:Uncharacterized protein n=1 Tax=hydrothermal vent metagenome TaxID=652676 RepID=A0A3B0ZIF3_9ZZZZ